MICVPLTTVVFNGPLFSKTTAPVRKLVPFTVSVKAGPPAVTEVGEMLLIVGVGGATVRGSGLDAALPGLVTVTGIGPCCWIRLAGTAAVTCVELTKVVVSDVVPRSAVAPDTKFVPLIVNVNAGPFSGTVAGEMLLSVGG